MVSKTISLWLHYSTAGKLSIILPSLSLSSIGMQFDSQLANNLGIYVRDGLSYWLCRSKVFNSPMFYGWFFLGCKWHPWVDLISDKTQLNPLKVGKTIGAITQPGHTTDADLFIAQIPLLSPTSTAQHGRAPHFSRPSSDFSRAVYSIMCRMKINGTPETGVQGLLCSASVSWQNDRQVTSECPANTNGSTLVEYGTSLGTLWGFPCLRPCYGPWMEGSQNGVVTI